MTLDSSSFWVEYDFCRAARSRAYARTLSSAATSSHVGAMRTQWPHLNVRTYVDRWVNQSVDLSIESRKTTPAAPSDASAQNVPGRVELDKPVPRGGPRRRLRQMLERVVRQDHHLRLPRGQRGGRGHQQLWLRWLCVWGGRAML